VTTKTTQNDLTAKAIFELVRQLASAKDLHNVREAAEAALFILRLAEDA